MPISTHLLRKLQETLGVEAAEDLSHLLESMDADRGDIREFRHETQLQFAAVRADFRADMASLNQDLRQEMVKSNHALREDMTRFRIDVLEAVRQVDIRVANTRADLLKWSFTFWVGAVLAIAALAGVLRIT
jgi:hypothetical protein